MKKSDKKLQKEQMKEPQLSKHFHILIYQTLIE